MTTSAKGDQINIEDNDNLISLPECIGQIPNLTVLWIRSNPNLASLPNSLNQLTGLLSLGVQYNNLTTLPDTICQITQLTSLRAYSDPNRPLASLPDCIGQLTNLLWLGIREYDGLGADLCKLTSLTLLTVTITDNLANLVSCLRQLPILTRLTITPDSQQTAILSTSLCQLTQLTSLAFDGNYGYSNDMSTLPDCIGQLTNLTELGVYNSHYKPLPSDALCRITSLTKLSFGSVSNLARLPDCIGQLTNLTELDISNTGLTSLPNSLCQLLPGLTINTGDTPLSSLLDCTTT